MELSRSFVTRWTWNGFAPACGALLRPGVLLVAAARRLPSRKSVQAIRNSIWGRRRSGPVPSVSTAQLSALLELRYALQTSKVTAQRMSSRASPSDATGSRPAWPGGAVPSAAPPPWVAAYHGYGPPPYGHGPAASAHTSHPYYHPQYGMTQPAAWHPPGARALPAAEASAGGLHWDFAFCGASRGLAALLQVNSGCNALSMFCCARAAYHMPPPVLLPQGGGSGAMQLPQDPWTVGAPDAQNDDSDDSWGRRRSVTAAHMSHWGAGKVHALKLCQHGQEYFLFISFAEVILH